MPILRWKRHLGKAFCSACPHAIAPEPKFITPSRLGELAWKAPGEATATVLVRHLRSAGIGMFEDERPKRRHLRHKGHPIVEMPRPPHGWCWLGRPPGHPGLLDILRSMALRFRTLPEEIAEVAPSATPYRPRVRTTLRRSWSSRGPPPRGRAARIPSIVFAASRLQKPAPARSCVT